MFTWHGTCAFVASTKRFSDVMARESIAMKMVFHRLWTTVWISFVKKGLWRVADSPKKKINSQNSDVPNSLNICSDENVVCFLFGVIYIFLNRRYANIMVCDKSLMTSPCWLKWCLGVARQQTKYPIVCWSMYMNRPICRPHDFI